MSRLTDLFPPLPTFGEEFAWRPWAAFGEEGYPALNVWEKDAKVYVEAELPGVAAESLDISVAGADLTISGARKAVEVKDGAWNRRERPAGTFSRTVTLPWDVEADKVEATLRDGVLTIVLTKAAHCLPKKVVVQPA